MRTIHKILLESRENEETKQQLEKITKYSIRKLTVGVGPVAIGAFLFGASPLSVDKVQSQ